jgi:hypothetical protein
MIISSTAIRVVRKDLLRQGFMVAARDAPVAAIPVVADRLISATARVPTYSPSNISRRWNSTMAANDNSNTTTDTTNSLGIVDKPLLALDMRAVRQIKVRFFNEYFSLNIGFENLKCFVRDPLRFRFHLTCKISIVLPFIVFSSSSSIFFVPSAHSG